jgi:polyhydroxyalkanoate synthase
MYCWYLRHTYLKNELKVPGKLTVCGEKVDLGAIEAPVFVYGSREDHIVPWKAAYEHTRAQGQACASCSAPAGHIAGVINPPAKGKRSHWIQRQAAGRRRRLVRRRHRTPGQLVARLVDWLKPLGGKLVPRPRRMATAAQGHRAGAGPLRQGQGLNFRPNPGEPP